VLIIVALVGGVLYGLNSGKQTQQAQIQSLPPTAAPQVTDQAHFGEDVPIVETPPPETAPPPVLLPPSPPPANTPAPATAAPASILPTGPSPAQVAEEKRADAERQRELDEEKARADALHTAQLSPIFVSSGGGGSGGFSGNGGGGNAPSGSNGESRATGGGAPGSAGATGGGAPGSAGATGGGAPGGAGAAGGGGAGSGGSAGAGGGGGTGGGAAGAASAGGAAAPGAATFLSGPTGQFAPPAYLPEGTRNNLQASRYAPSTIFELLAGAVIPAELVTGIDSEVPGLVTGQVREDVYDTKSGKYLLIPKGTRLIGVYQAVAGYGSSRVLVAWQRLIFPDTSSIDLLNMTGADVQGGGGLGGKVDNHTGQLIFGTLLSSILSAGLALSQPTTTAVATTTGGTVAVPSQGALAAQAIGAQLTTTTQGLINKTLNQPPTVYVPKGYPFLVIVDRDIVFPGPYGPSL
jgi:type IV secretion system protein VirB10